MTDLPKGMKKDLEFLLQEGASKASYIPINRNPLGATHLQLVSTNGEVRNITVARWKKLETRQLVHVEYMNGHPKKMMITDLGSKHITTE
jgi:hypothetical protein